MFFPLPFVFLKAALCQDAPRPTKLARYESMLGDINQAGIPPLLELE